MSISGDAILEAGNKLMIDINGTTPGSQFDQLNVAGQLRLGGTLEVSLAGFSPAVGNSFDILNAAGIFETFDALELPALSPNLMWHLSQLYTTGVLRVALAGDFNLDGTVNAADYVVWRKNVNGVYTQSDFDMWRAHFGLPVGSGAGEDSNANVPEPAGTLALILRILATRIVIPRRVRR
jgi:hypothetical protein